MCGCMLLDAMCVDSPNTLRGGQRTAHAYQSYMSVSLTCLDQLLEPLHCTYRSIVVVLAVEACCICVLGVTLGTIGRQSSSSQVVQQCCGMGWCLPVVSQARGLALAALL